MSFVSPKNIHREVSSQAFFLRQGNLVLRLARSEEEIEAAQKLRYQVFYEELGAHPTPKIKHCQRDFDEFDPYADHLLVILENDQGEQKIIATYRLLRSSVAKKLGHYYSENEYDISPLKNIKEEILEVGRSCVAKNYRGKTVVKLLWEGIAFYIQSHNISLLFGCASFHTIHPSEVASELSYLYTHRLAPPSIRVKALDNLYVSMEQKNAQKLPFKQLNFPPLIKGYLRLGAFVGDGAVIDPQFNTTDIAILVETKLMTHKYFNHYKRRLTHILDE